MSRRRRPCANCGANVDRFQHSHGVVAAYPCGCWYTPARARALAAAAAEAGEHR